MIQHPTRLAHLARGCQYFSCFQVSLPHTFVALTLKAFVGPISATTQNPVATKALT